MTFHMGYKIFCCRYQAFSINFAKAIIFKHPAQNPPFIFPKYIRIFFFFYTELIQKESSLNHSIKDNKKEKLDRNYLIILGPECCEFYQQPIGFHYVYLPSTSFNRTKHTVYLLKITWSVPLI